MAPRIEKSTFVENYETNEKNDQSDLKNRNLSPDSPVVDNISTTTTTNNKKFQPRIVWRNVMVFIILHIGAMYGIYCCFDAKIKTILFGYFLYILGGLGITGGAHRLWAHRSYKAKLPLRILLGIFQTMALQNSIYEWSRDHRVHHKYSETDADPHNTNRGFFFSHMGWLMMKKHPEVIKKGSQIPSNDLLSDPVVYYQHKFYKPLAIFFCMILPTILPVFFWNESIMNAYFICGILKYVITLHVTWLVNSVAHMWGYKPYDKRITPVENIFISIGAIGEGFHNFHHTFPRDYATSEFGWIYFNLTKGFIDVMAFLGQVSDRNKTTPEVVYQTRLKIGDLSLVDQNNQQYLLQEQDY